jgi:hypothetical protein
LFFLQNLNSYQPIKVDILRALRKRERERETYKDLLYHRYTLQAKLGTGGMGIEESLHKELQNKTLFQTIF